jgi:hypothetical protein
MPKYKLVIQRAEPKRHMSKQKDKLLFYVIDLEKGNFPQNFVCTFPIAETLYSKPTVFNSIFCENEAKNAALNLLIQAKSEYSDWGIQKAIDKRLSGIDKNRFKLFSNDADNLDQNYRSLLSSKHRLSLLNNIQKYRKARICSFT